MRIMGRRKLEEDKVRFSLYMSKEVLDNARKAAEDKGMSINMWVQGMMVEGIEVYEGLERERRRIARIDRGTGF